MDKFKTIGVGGLPHTLDDFRQFLGRLDAPSEGIYQAFNNILGGFGTDFIVQGCVLSGSTGAFSITEGWILLSSELIKVDAQGPFDESVNGTFTKVTGFDSRGTKTFLNGSVNETYEKNRGVINGLAGSLDFNGDRIEELIGLQAWTEETFDAGDFTATTGAWTVTGAQTSSIVKGKTMTVAITVAVSALAGGPSDRVAIAIPQSKVAKTGITTQTGIGFIFTGGVRVTAVLQVATAGTVINVQPMDGTDIANGSVLVGGTFTFEID